MKTLDKKGAFFQVIDSHWWLAASGCAWKIAGPDATEIEEKNEVHRLLPNIVVMIRDCLLLHARSLIKFYRCSKRHDTDIVLGDFGIPKIESAVDTELEGYERPIEVHFLHLTDSRNPDYRNSHSPDRGTTIRQDWDREVRVIAEKLIFDCLRHASERSGDWQRPFKSLLDATEGGYGDKSYPWPKCLGEKSDVENYLKSLGILARQTSPP